MPATWEAPFEAARVVPLKRGSVSPNPNPNPNTNPSPSPNPHPSPSPSPNPHPHPHPNPIPSPIPDQVDVTLEIAPEVAQDLTLAQAKAVAAEVRCREIQGDVGEVYRAGQGGRRRGEV